MGEIYGRSPLSEKVQNLTPSHLELDDFRINVGKNHVIKNHPVDWEFMVVCLGNGANDIVSLTLKDFPCFFPMKSREFYSRRVSW